MALIRQTSPPEEPPQSISQSKVIDGYHLQKKRKKIGINEKYFWMYVIRHKISEESSKPGYSLRVLVSHINLLESLVTSTIPWHFQLKRIFKKKLILQLKEDIEVQGRSLTNELNGKVDPTRGFSKRELYSNAFSEFDFDSDSGSRAGMHPQSLI